MTTNPEPIDSKPEDAIETIGEPHTINGPHTINTAPDPFDLTSLRLDQSFVETAGIKKLLTTVPVGKPNPQDFIRVHPSEAYRDVFAVIELKEEREFHLLHHE